VGGFTDWRDSRSRLGFETKGTETLGLVSVSLQSRFLNSLGLGLVFLLIFPEVLGLVSFKNIGNLRTLLRYHRVLVSVSRLKARDSRSRLGRVPLLIFKKSRSRTRPFFNF
jgi:hypothetical protein